MELSGVSLIWVPFKVGTGVAYTERPPQRRHKHNNLMKNKTTSVLRLLAAVASLAILGAVTSTLHADDAPAAPAPTPIAFADAPLKAQTAYLHSELLLLAGFGD